MILSNRDNIKAVLNFPIENPIEKTINKVIYDNDFLGFGTIDQAKNAILTHSDWENRWELNNQEDIDFVQNWRNTKIKK